MIGGLLILTVVSAIQLYRRYLATSRAPWAFLGHDRNSHLLESLLLALDLRYLDLISLIGDLHRMKVHPPLFRVLAAPILVLGSFDHRLAVLVSLAGWIGTVLLVCLLARRLAPSHKNAAGLFAAFCTVSSPPFQAYATDIMLESLGACLTLLVLYLYIAARDPTGSTRGFTLLGCGLTALFFLKYNYWLITGFSLLLWEGVSRSREATALLRRSWTREGLRTFIARHARDAVTWTLSGIVALAVLLAAAGKQQFFWGGRRITTRASLDLAYPAFLILWMRVAVPCWLHREKIRARLGEPAWRLICSHLLPVSLWLLWPLKLQHFLLYLSPSDSTEMQRTGYWSWDTLRFYPAAILTEYHASVLMGLAVVALALYAHLRPSRSDPHGGLVLLFLAVSATLTILHPNHQSRFVYTWIPLLWVAAALGLASILGQLASAGFSGTLASRSLQTALGVAFVTSSLVSVFLGRGSTDAGSRSPTALDLSDYYLPKVGCYGHMAIFATVPLDFFAWWTYLERYPTQRRNLSIVMKRLGGSEGVSSKGFAEWLGRTASQAIVFIDIPAGSVFYWPGNDGYQTYRGLVESQTAFHEVERRAFPEYGATVSILARGGRDTPASRCVEAQAAGHTPSSWLRRRSSGPVPKRDEVAPPKVARGLRGPERR